MKTLNERRAERAFRALLANYEDFQQDHRSAMVDLLTDLRHLAPQYGIDFDKANTMAAVHYQAETSGDEGEL
jgi:hypothetical protein